MNIIQLHFQNINSFRGNVHIDFTAPPLADCSVFAITGATGAGKSSILDAITLALFGRAARYKNARSPDSVITRGQQTCFSDICFETHKGRYSARWELQLSKKGAKRMTHQFIDGDGKVLTSKTAEVEQHIIAVTGLDYERFLRSVLLAQGQFRDFLDAPVKERATLLEKITGAELYSRLGALAYTTAKDWEKRINEIEEGIERSAGSDASDSSSLEERKGELSSQLLEIQRTKKQLSEEARQLSEMEELQTERSNTTAKLKALEAKNNEQQEREEKRKQHQNTLLLQGPMSTWQQKKDESGELEQKLAESRAELQQKEANYHQILSSVLEHFDSWTQEKEGEITEAEEKMESISRQVELLKEWLVDHQHDAGLETVLADIRPLGEQCRMLELKQTDSRKKIEQALQDREELKVKLSDLKEQIQLQEDKSLSLQKNISKIDASMKENIGERNFEDLQGETERKSSSLENYEEYYDDYRKLCSQQEQSETEEKKLQQKEKKAAKELEELEDRMRKHSSELLRQRRIYEQSLVIADLTKQRDALRAGEPCPLCGSLEHPYQNEELTIHDRDELAELERQEQELQAEQQRKEAACNELRVQNATISTDINNYQKQKKSLRKKLEPLIQCTDATSSDSIMTKIETSIRKERTQLAELRAQLEQIRSFQKDRDEVEEEVQALKQGVELNKQEYAQMETASKKLQAEVETEEGEYNKRDGNYTELRAQFMQATAPWKCSGDTAEITAQLEKRLHHWKLKNSEQNDMEDAKEKCMQDITKNKGEIKEFQKEKRLRQEQLDKLPAIHSISKISIIQSEEIQETTARIKLCDEARSGYDEALKGFETVGGELSQAKEKTGELYQSILQKLPEYGFSSISECEDARLSTEELGMLERELEGYHQAVTESKTLDKDIAEKIESLSRRLPAQLRNFADEDLRQKIEQTQKQMEEQELEQNKLNEEIGGIHVALKRIEELKQEEAEYRQQLEQLRIEAAPWQELQSLIGSAEGDKFSRFAQNITMRQLLSIANRHLKILNPRYALKSEEVDEGLNFAVLDMYQAEMLRPVQSLSGGEGFLVSLALALSLSELLSRHMQIECLFIDEGFGSLDQESLDIALDALKNIASGRQKIGMISHVEALKEGIPCQIHVHRKKDGYAALRML